MAHIISECQNAQTQKSEQCIMQSGITYKSKRQQKYYGRFQIRECSTQQNSYLSISLKWSEINSICRQSCFDL